MNNILNLNTLKTAMAHTGLNQIKLAKALEVEEKIVSGWIKGNIFPPPDQLLKLALLLELPFEELIKQMPSNLEPVVAFRQKNYTETNLADAKTIGRLLTVLVPYLPYDEFMQPATLKKPVNEYAYLQKVVTKIRTDIGLKSVDVLDFHHLLKKFQELQAVLIPVFWGQENKYALHIYLPDSMTTWIYLNLDSEIHDFKFWMAHELGHVYAPSLKDDEAENFADAFAATLLFPEQSAKSAYEVIIQLENIDDRLKKINHLAKKHLISPLSVYLELKKYIHYHNLAKIDDLENGVYQTIPHFHKQFPRLSETLFEGKKPMPAAYLKTCQNIFDTPFFETLQKYLIETRKAAGFIQNILDIPLLDAKAIHADLS